MDSTELQTIDYQKARTEHRANAQKLNAERDANIEREEADAKAYIEANADVMTAFHEHMKANLEDVQTIADALKRIEHRGHQPAYRVWALMSELIISKRSHNEYLPYVEQLYRECQPELNEYVGRAVQLGLKLPIDECKSLQLHLKTQHDNWRMICVDRRTADPEGPMNLTQRGTM